MPFPKLSLYKRTNGQTDRRTNRQTDKQTDGQTDRETDRQTDTDKIVNYSNSRCACTRGLISINKKCGTRPIRYSTLPLGNSSLVYTALYLLRQGFCTLVFFINPQRACAARVTVRVYARKLKNGIRFWRCLTSEVQMSRSQFPPFWSLFFLLLLLAHLLRYSVSTMEIIQELGIDYTAPTSAYSPLIASLPLHSLLSVRDELFLSATSYGLTADGDALVSRRDTRKNPFCHRLADDENSLIVCLKTTPLF